MGRAGVSKYFRVLKGAGVVFLVLFGAALLSGCATSGGAVSAASSSVQGVATVPMEGVYIFVYKKGDIPHGPPYTMSEAPTGPDGSFSISLPDGEYTIVARRHKNGLAGSPLSEGDLKSPPVPVTVRGGRLTVGTVVLHEKTSSFRYFKPDAKTKTAISGKILDSDGNPMKGFRVHVYTYAQMSERPKYVSSATEPDGSYIVFLPKGGTYYLAARDHFGGPPKIGDYYGRYDEGTIDPTAVIVKTGQTLGDINITVHKVW